ncbi:MAG: 50S ribosomal protein L21 [Alphaproteobacteria bacterium]|nr:50S ribosomal protein L21 [Alphaproteobacteria bacterium]
MALAVIDIAGKQFSAKVGTNFWMDKMPNEVGEVLALRRTVLFVDEKECKIGEPFDESVVVFLRVHEHARDKKVLVFKKKRRHGYRRLKGFRADQTRVEIVAIDAAPAKKVYDACAVGELSGALDKALIPEMNITKSSAKEVTPKAASKAKAEPKAEAPKAKAEPKKAEAPKAKAEPKKAAAPKAKAEPKKAAASKKAENPAPNTGAKK